MYCTYQSIHQFKIVETTVLFWLGLFGLYWT